MLSDVPFRRMLFRRFFNYEVFESTKLMYFCIFFICFICSYIIRLVRIDCFPTKSLIFLNCDVASECTLRYSRTALSFLIVFERFSTSLNSGMDERVLYCEDISLLSELMSSLSSRSNGGPSMILRVRPMFMVGDATFGMMGSIVYSSLR